MDYIKRIKEVKNARKMTNDELAERTGIPGGTLSKILAGISESPKFCNIVAICEALNCSLDYIMYGEEENKNNYLLDDEEIEVIERYRALDTRGKVTVRGVLDHEASFAEGGEQPPKRNARVFLQKTLKERLAHACVESDNGLTRRSLPLFDLPISAGPGEFLDGEEKGSITVRDTTRTREADFALRISGNSMEPRYHDGDILLVQRAESVEFGELGVFILDGCGFFKVYGGDRLYSLNPEYGDILLKDFESIRVAGRVIGKLKKR